MVNVTRYKRHKNGFGLHSSVYTSSRKCIESKSFVSDYCSWESAIKEYPDFSLCEFDLMWKKMVIQGLYYGLSKIDHKECIEIILKDIDGHVMHANNYSMFAAGILAAFVELKVTIDNDDLENLYEFVGSSKGKDFGAIPEISKLDFKEYYVYKIKDE